MRKIFEMLDILIEYEVELVAAMTNVHIATVSIISIQIIIRDSLLMISNASYWYPAF